MTPELADKLAHLPTGPGVYQHKNADGKVLYVGKAKNLRNRVRSYFRESRPRDARLQALVNKIADVEVIVTDTEAEALILENNLIKRLKPRYNVNLRDDKTYPYICIKNERFPRVFTTRRVVRDGSRYFGPYTDGKRLRILMQTIRDLFQIRTCTLRLTPENIAAGKFSVCLEYHIKKCAGPCEGLQSEADYDETIEQIVQLLNGKTRGLIAELEADMREHAAAMRFEQAAALRDRIDALRKYSERQKIISQDLTDRDVCSLAVDREKNVAAAVVFKVRDGKIIGRQHKLLLKGQGLTEGELLQIFLEDYYSEATFFPDEVLTAFDLPEPGPLSEHLRDRKGRKVTIRRPERGEKAQLVGMTTANAELLLGEYLLEKAKRDEGRVPHAVLQLKEDLRLPSLPRHIECFDISHLGGTGTVASCVVFIDGKPRKSEYRTYKIKTAEGKPDDFQSMREVVERRYLRLEEENRPWPDLIVIDGGKGQLSSVVDVFKELGLYGKAPVIGLAKRLEEVFFPGDKDPVQIPKTSSSLRLLQRVRDEAHRFAVTFQRKQRKQRLLHSELQDIPGIGEKTTRKLLQRLGSVRAVREADSETLADIAGPAAARRIRRYFDGSNNEPA